MSLGKCLAALIPCLNKAVLTLECASGKEFREFETNAKGVKAHFVDGTEVEGAIIVGADGAGSRLRKELLQNPSIYDTEGRFIVGKTILTSELEKRFHQKAQAGMTETADQSSGVPLKLIVEPIRFQDNEYGAVLPRDYIY